MIGYVPTRREILVLLTKGYIKVKGDVVLALRQQMYFGTHCQKITRICVVPTQAEIRELKLALQLLDEAEDMDVIEQIMDDGCSYQEASHLYCKVLRQLQDRAWAH